MIVNSVENWANLQRVDSSLTKHYELDIKLYKRRVYKQIKTKKNLCFPSFFSFVLVSSKTSNEPNNWWPKPESNHINKKNELQP